MRLTLRRLLVLAALSVAPLRGSAAAESGPELAQRVLERAGAIVSGKLEYVYHGRTRGAPPRDYDSIYAFDGDDWAQYSDVARGGKTINREGYCLHYVISPQRNGSKLYRVDMKPPVSFSSRPENNRPPIFAGSLWYESELKYLAEHASQARIVGERAIDGVSAQQLDLEVPAEHWQAFYVLHPQLSNGGTLRLFVAPSLGYALPRYEHVDPNGLVVYWVDGEEFKEQAPGVYLPRRLSMSQLDKHDKLEFTMWYDITASLINQPIPAAEFEVSVPLGAEVSDARDPAHMTHFRVTRTSPSTQLAAMSDRIRGLPPPRSPRTVAWVMLGSLGGALLAVGLLLGYRHAFA